MRKTGVYPRFLLLFLVTGYSCHARIPLGSRSPHSSVVRGAVLTCREINEVMSIYQLVIKIRDSDGNQFRNVHHYEFAGYVPNDTELQEFVDNWDAEFKAHVRTNMSDEFTVYAYDVKRVDLAGLPSQEFVPTAGTYSGTLTGQALPHQVAALVTFKARTTYPRTTRSYLCGITENANTDDIQVGPSARSDFETWGEDILSIDVTGQLNPDKVAVKYTGSPPAVTSNNEVTTVTANPVWATQRRRRPGTGI